MVDIWPRRAGSNMTLDTLHSYESQDSYYGPPDNLPIPQQMINQQPVPFVALSSLSRSQYLLECRPASTVPLSISSSQTPSSSSDYILRPKSSIGWGHVMRAFFLNKISNRHLNYNTIHKVEVISLFFYIIYKQ